MADILSLSLGPNGMEVPSHCNTLLHELNNTSGPPLTTIHPELLCFSSESLGTTNVNAHLLRELKGMSKCFVHDSNSLTELISRSGTESASEKRKRAVSVGSPLTIRSSTGLLSVIASNLAALHSRAI